MTVLAWQKGGRVRGPAVVPLHGWARDGVTEWQDTAWVAALGHAGYTAYVPDLPGHAASADVKLPIGKVPAAWTARTILADLDQLGVDGFAAVGHAEGCATAAHLAALQPSRVSRLVLIGCDDRAGLPHGEDVAAGLRDSAATVWKLEAAEHVARARADMRHDLATLADWAEGLSWPAAPRLGALPTPVLCAVGGDGSHRERAPRLARLFRDARLVTVPGDERSMLAGTELIDAVLDFLAGEQRPALGRR